MVSRIISVALAFRPAFSVAFAFRRTFASSIPRIAIQMLAIAVVFASAATAQTESEPVETRSVGIGALWSFPPGAERLSAIPGVKVSLRQWYGPHLGSEVHLGWWRGETATEFNAPASRTVQGVYVPESHSVSRDAQTEGSIAVAVLGRIPHGRVTTTLGIGPGWFSDRQEFESRGISGGLEYHDKGTHTYSSFGVHAMIEVDVRATRTMSVFVGFLSEVHHVRYVESNFTYPNAGLRFAF